MRKLTSVLIISIMVVITIIIVKFYGMEKRYHSNENSYSIPPPPSR
ncbi:hypothetical protein [Flavobacterium algicola]|nr:hypothetical protein [Flavobacterium algicola]MCG9792562.1 hypothetical protein [Flavobacterium algicola]